MRPFMTLHRELITALALVFAGALVVGITGVILLLPALSTPAQATAYLIILLAADVLVFALFGRYLLQRRVLRPLEHMIAGVERIAAGDYASSLPAGDTEEMRRLAQSVNHMAAGLINQREQLAANVRSLDETNRQLTEARDELIRAEKMVSTGQLAAGLAHEIGNPLTAIIGYLAVFGRGIHDEAGRELIASADREAQRIDRIIRGLLDYARPRETAMRPIEVNPVVQQTWELLVTQGRFENLGVRLDLARDLPAVVAEPYHLQQVLVNLLLNATDALAEVERPELVVATRRSIYRPKLPLPARRKDDPPDVDYSHRRRFHERPQVPRADPFPGDTPVVEIQVRDNGPGIPSELLDHVFEPFATTKDPGKGTGLGLAVAARLIDAMDGTIRVESGNGRGATFTVVLPAAPEDDDERMQP